MHTLLAPRTDEIPVWRVGASPACTIRRMRGGRAAPDHVSDTIAHPRASPPRSATALGRGRPTVAPGIPSTALPSVSPSVGE